MSKKTFNDFCLSPEQEQQFKIEDMATLLFGEDRKTFNKELFKRVSDYAHKHFKEDIMSDNESTLDTFRTLLRLKNANKINIDIYKKDLKDAKKNYKATLESILEEKIWYAKRMIDEIDGRMELWAGDCDSKVYTSSVCNERVATLLDK